MARTITEIKAEITSAFISQETVRSKYGLDDNATFDKAFSPISLESVMFYVVASCIWVLETLFDKHRVEVDERIEALRPHTLRWYVAKTLDYMHNGKFVRADGVIVGVFFTPRYPRAFSCGKQYFFGCGNRRACFVDF